MTTSKLYKFLAIYILIGLVFLFFKIAYYSTVEISLTSILVFNLLPMFITVVIIGIAGKFAIQKYTDLNKLKHQKINEEYQQTIKNIYDEHIYSISHELRSPLSVISANSITLLNNLKTLYKNNITLNEDVKYVQKMKSEITTIQMQIENIESFISSISEHGSYISEKDNHKLINMHAYLSSIIMNSYAYSRNMKVFNNNIDFGDGFGRDFENIHAVSNVHDLTRILMNLFTNSADAVLESLKSKTTQGYIPNLKIRCIKSNDEYQCVKLGPEFIPINVTDEPSSQFYLIIEDNGSGISKENLKKIFEYGFSTKNATDGAVNHYGLGLYISILLANKNDIEVYVKTDSNGTQFALGFPRIYIFNKYESTGVIKTDFSKNEFSDDSNNLFKSTNSSYCNCKEGSTNELLVIFKKESDIYGDIND